tara:strand:- start:193 stop:1284 length:1092 start_codon:yes stop_codon:yes gene_type:complete
MAFDRSRYKSDGQLIFEDRITATGDVQKVPTFQLPDFADGSDAYANKFATVLSFQNIRDPDRGNVFFKAFITAFNETFTPNFNATEVFGRTDPIMQYKNTSRNITLAWKLPAASESEAYENLGRVQKLLTMLYPTYTDVGNSLSLSEAPLVRLKVMNLLQERAKAAEIDKLVSLADDRNVKDIYLEYSSVNEADLGLLGVITSCTVNHNLEGTDGVFQKGFNTVLPKLIDISISFTPLHEQTLGFGNGSDISTFPYGVRMGESFSDGMQAGNPNEVQRGNSLTQLRAIKEDIEKKRRGASSAQQKADKAEAKARRASRKLGRRGNNMDPERRTRLEGNVEAFAGAQEEADAFTSQADALEDLI